MPVQTPALTRSQRIGPVNTASVRMRAPKAPTARTAPAPAPASATPMQHEKVAHELNSKLEAAKEKHIARRRTTTDGASPVRRAAANPKAVPISDADRIEGNAASIKSNVLKAKSVGVDATKRSFWTKVLGVGISALALAVVVSLTVATGGAPLAAAVAIAGVVLAVSVADACCAHMNFRNAQKLERGEAPTYKLPMGDSSIGNLAYLFFKGVFKAENPVLRAQYVDIIFRTGMMLIAGFCTANVSVVANSFEQIAPLVGAAVNLTTMLLSFVPAWRSDSTYIKNVKEINKAFDDLVTMTANLPVAEQNEMTQKIETAREESLAGIKALRGAVPKRGLTAGRVMASGGWIASGLLAVMFPNSMGAHVRGLVAGSTVFFSPVTGSNRGVATPQAVKATPNRIAETEKQIASAVSMHIVRTMAHMAPLTYAKIHEIAQGISADHLPEGQVADADFLSIVMERAVANLSQEGALTAEEGQTLITEIHDALIGEKQDLARLSLDLPHSPLAALPDDSIPGPPPDEVDDDPGPPPEGDYIPGPPPESEYIPGPPPEMAVSSAGLPSQRAPLDRAPPDPQFPPPPVGHDAYL